MPLIDIAPTLADDILDTRTQVDFSNDHREDEALVTANINDITSSCSNDLGANSFSPDPPNLFDTPFNDSMYDENECVFAYANRYTPPPSTDIVIEALAQKLSSIIWSSGYTAYSETILQLTVTKLSLKTSTQDNPCSSTSENSVTCLSTCTDGITIEHPLPTVIEHQHTFRPEPHEEVTPIESVPSTETVIEYTQSSNNNSYGGNLSQATPDITYLSSTSSDRPNVIEVSLATPPTSPTHNPQTRKRKQRDDVAAGDDSEGNKTKKANRSKAHDEILSEIRDLVNHTEKTPPEDKRPSHTNTDLASSVYNAVRCEMTGEKHFNRTNGEALFHWKNASKFVAEYDGEDGSGARSKATPSTTKRFREEAGLLHHSKDVVKNHLRITRRVGRILGQLPDDIVLKLTRVTPNTIHGYTNGYVDFLAAGVKCILQDNENRERER